MPALEHWWPLYGSRGVCGLFAAALSFDALPPGLPAAEQAARPQFPIVESDLRAIQRRPVNRAVRWCSKVRDSFYKRRIDLLAFAQRRRKAAAVD